MSNVVSIATKNENNRSWSVETMLEDVVEEIRNGGTTPTKAIVIMLDDSGKALIPNWRACNASATEQLAMLEIYKQIVLRSMGL